MSEVQPNSAIVTYRERKYEEALNRIASLEPEQATVPLDRVFSLLREAIQVANSALNTP